MPEHPRIATSSRRRHRSHSSLGVARLPVVASLAALLVAAGLTDHLAGGSPSYPTPSPLPPVPAVAPAAALSSSWFCAGATDGPAAKAPSSPSAAGAKNYNVARGHAPGRVVISNAGSRALGAKVRIVASHNRHRVVGLVVGPHSQAIVPETMPGGAAWLGAMVNLSGGAASVEQLIVSPLGVSSTPCATAGSRHWYFPTGATLVNEGVELNLLNPYPSAAIVDLSFDTNLGPERPGSFEGLVVPARGILSVNLGSRLRRRTRIATTVSARSIPVVAWQTTVVTPPAKGATILGSAKASAPGADPAAAVAGVTDLLGAASTSRHWWWPAGQSGKGVAETYAVYDPGTRSAKVRLSIHLDAGKAEPFDLTVAPGAVATVTSSAQARIPAGVGYWATLTSLNGVPVVGERSVVYSSPSPYYGRSEVIGAQMPARRWLLAGDPLGHSQQLQVVVCNPGTSPLHAKLVSFSRGSVAAIPGVGSMVIAAGQRKVVTLAPRTPSSKGSAAAGPRGSLGVVLVAATGPVVVEDGLYGVSGTHGVGASIATPVGER